ncbi:MAG TPA: hypothetical protein VH855_12085 [Acetobacteraceae bacterium]|jgi:hypothetical protein
MRGRGWLDKAGSGIGRTAIMASLVAGLLAGGVAMVAAATTLDLGPKVGDILVFRHGARVPADWAFAVTRSAPNAAACSLRPDVMAAHGGSLVVEERFTNPRGFRVHWAGGPTSVGTADCGVSADLLVSGTDLQLLSNVVGGPGVEPSSFTRF